MAVKANTQASAEDRMSDEEFLGHMTYVPRSLLTQESSFTFCSSLMFAAMDTTSSALSRILYTLAEHPEVQEKLRQEIKEAHTEDGNMEYDKLMTLPYLEAVCRETLRVYVTISSLWCSMLRSAMAVHSQSCAGRHDVQDVSILHSRSVRSTCAKHHIERYKTL